jgi:hypothetical protein
MSSNIFKVAVLVLFLSANQALATHLRCGEISVVQVSANAVDISIRVYTNVENTTVLFGGDQDVLDFGDGHTMLVPESPNLDVEGVAPNVKMATFTIRHVYSAPGNYLVSYKEPNRNEGIINFDASVTTTFYVETNFTIDPFLEDFSSPEAFFHPIFYASTNQPFSASLASSNPKGSELHYTLTTPLQDRQRMVVNFRLPENLKVDLLSGLITWDNKLNGEYVTGEYLFAVRIEQFDKIDGKTVRTGYVYRDFQVTLEDSPLEGGRTISDNIEDESLDVFENNSTSFKVFTPFLEGEEVGISLASDLPEENFFYNTYDSTTASGNLKVTAITVSTDGSIVRNHPYIISIRNTFRGPDKIISTDVNYIIYTEVYDPILSNEENRTKGTLVPNPVNDFVTLGNSVSEAATLEIINANGRAVTPIRIDHQNKWDLSNLKPGVYIVRIRDKAGKLIATDRLVKQ